VSIISLIYYTSISQHKERKGLWTKYIITGNQKYLFALELMIKTEQITDGGIDKWRKQEFPKTN
jgi:hypothetical protein